MGDSDATFSACSRCERGAFSTAGVFYGWLCLELAFYLVVKYILYPRLNRLRRPPRNPATPRTSMLRVLDTVERLKEVYGFERFFQGWFRGASMEEIKAENVKVSGLPRLCLVGSP
jgi:hypothetical protein